MAGLEERGEGGEHLEGGAIDVLDQDPLAPIGVFVVGV